ncbi:MAG: hypothetical protein JO115_11050 [Pseudonocardiales bacterium]|nr:hypothetical protein [Pseudonocardiales bacterium]
MTCQDFFPRDDNTAAPNSLDVARDTFTWLVTGPRPLSIDGRRFPGLPHRRVALDELRDRLLAYRCPQTTRDAVWAHLVRRSRSRGASWTVGAVGVALPALTSVAAQLSARFAGDPADVHAEVLRGFLTELPVIDLRRPRIMLRLRWAAYRSGHAALSEALGGPTPTGLGARSGPPTSPWGHPDLVLARAVAEGVLTRTEADLIGATRLEEIPLAEWARAHSAGLKTTYSTRERAERRLVAYLCEATADTDAEDPVAHTALAIAALLDPTDRPAPQPEISLSVSGRRRNGRPAPTQTSSDSVRKTDPKSGVQNCRTTPPAPRLPEVPQCA